MAFKHLTIAFLSVHLSLTSQAAASPELLEEDLETFDMFVMKFGERPPDASVRRVMAAARSQPDDVRICFFALLSMQTKLTEEKVDVLPALTKAAANGNPRAMAVIATEMCAGRIDGADLRSAVEMLRRSSESGDPLADHQLGLGYLIGIPGVVEKNLDEAERCLRRSNARGMKNALGTLAKLASMRGDQEKYMEAVVVAAEAGDGEAMSLLYMWYIRDPKLRNVDKAHYWARRGAMMGRKNLMTAYAMMLDEGVGTAKDPQLAFRFLQRARSLGDNEAKALIELGRATGRFGMQADRKTGFKKLEQLAESEVVEAQFILGKVLVEGLDAPKDSTRGRDLIRRAAAGGSIAAKVYLEQLR